MAGGRGFEPRLTESESVVLPLDDPPVDSPCGRHRGRVCIKAELGMQSYLTPGTDASESIGVVEYLDRALAVPAKTL